MRRSINIIFSICVALHGIKAFATPLSIVNCANNNEHTENTKLKLDSDKDQLEDLSYEVNFPARIEYGRKAHTANQTPHVAMKIGDKWLAGSNRGEWGGELVLIEPDKTHKILLKDNIHEIFRTEVGIIVVAGLSHLMNSSGRVYLVSENGSNLDYTLLFGLDAAPEKSWMTSEGEIFINTSYGASIIRTDGTLKRALCKNHEYIKFKGRS
ncbi:hypothetical protein QYS36_11280 [Pseudomonas sp. G34]|uniref:hypothetical protein n=1 Tax=Pseudomonas sp. G34 TaxID=3059083 RepID=UPI002806BD5C|nr:MULTISPECIES: hypothetical protein [unclassified Pseudomonas]MDQ7985516.1 hypothetical protein [Pseudomonas sp. G34]